MLALGSCGGSDESDPASPPGDPQGADFIKLSLDGATQVEFRESSGLPNIDCDPRVDWGFFQVILWDDFTDGSGPNGYDTFFEIMFPAADSVGTYTVHDDFLQALYHNGIDYAASPLRAASSGWAVVTRADSRIEGSFDLTLVDADEATTISLAGSFGVQRGFSTSCP